VPVIPSFSSFLSRILCGTTSNAFRVGSNDFFTFSTRGNGLKVNIRIVLPDQTFHPQ
jgi:hypothetical protein